ncbi:hypothetical protein [Alcanivorax sp.]|uniref:hypothetical protein n=1 Tax=Alcanivorax sp. TaxID=1872427 RepID=UPI00258B2D57|nr:hypothetical protein [Alcanivorax sp.]
MSYSLLGYSSHPTPSICENIADSCHRYILCYQRRQLIDAMLPFRFGWVSRFFLNLDGNFWFVCVAESSNKVNDPAPLSGKLFIFAGRDKWRGQAENIIRTAQDELRGFYDGRKPEKSLKNHFSDRYHSVLEELSKSADFHVSFEMQRSGITTIQCPDAMVLSDDLPHFPPQEERRERLTDVVCSQLFFFLKDIAHHHQHHSPYTDTLVDIYPLYDGDDLTWRGETIRTLARKVVQYKRHRRNEEFFSALGILAYAKAFLNLSSKELGEKARDIQPSLDLDSLAFSIKASQSATHSSNQEKIRRMDNLRSILIAVVGIFISMVGLANLTGKKFEDPSPNLLLIANYMIASPFITISIIMSIIFLGMVFTGGIDFPNWRWVRGLTRLVQPLSREAAVLTLFCIGLGALIISAKYAFG